MGFSRLFELFVSDRRLPWKATTVLLYTILFSPLVGLVLAYINCRKVAGSVTKGYRYMVMGALLFLAVIATETVAPSGISSAAGLITAASVLLIIDVWRTQRRVEEEYLARESQRPAPFASWISAIPYAVSVVVLLTMLLGLVEGGVVRLLT